MLWNADNYITCVKCGNISFEIADVFTIKEVKSINQKSKKTETTYTPKVLKKMIRCVKCGTMAEYPEDK